jgi:hypothetical protein
MTEQLAEEIFRKAGESIEVPQAPFDGVVERAREQRRRRLRTAAAAVAVCLVVVGLGTWAASRPEPRVELAPTHVVPSRNPITTAWYDGQLHLRAIAVDLPDVTSVAAVGEGAAYLDTRGDVGIVNSVGQRTVVGSAVPGSRVLGSGENNWAAWLEPGAQSSRLVVWTVALDEELDSYQVPPETRLLAIDQDRVYFQNDDGAFAWEPTALQPRAVAYSELADVGSATRVYQRGDRIEMVQPFFSVSYTRRGRGATVSPGGNFVLSRAPGPWVPGAPYTPLLYDTGSGQRLPTGVAPDERVVDAAFGDNYELVYLVAHVSELSGADLDGAGAELLVLRACELNTSAARADERVCHDVAPVRVTGDRAMFAH